MDDKKRQREALERILLRSRQDFDKDLFDIQDKVNKMKEDEVADEENDRIRSIYKVADRRVANLEEKGASEEDIERAVRRSKILRQLKFNK